MKIVSCIVAILFSVTPHFFVLVPPVPAQARGNVLADNEPPLTREMVGQVTDFFEWSLGIRLSVEQKAEIQRVLVDSWEKNERAEMNGTLEIVKLHSELSKLSDQRLGEIRGQVREEVLTGLRRQPGDKIAVMLLSLYESAATPGSPKQTAGPGEPGSRAKTSTATAASPPVKVGAGDIYGIYIATTKQLIAPGPDSPVQKGITWTPGREWITFLPGGRAYLGLPEEGLADFDFSAATRKHPESKGTYQVRGDAVYVRWAAGGEKHLKRTADGELWEERKNYTPLPKAAGLTLEGRYAVLWNEGSAKNFIRFGKDGSFEESGVLQFIGWKSLGSPRERAVVEIRRGSGTYVIDDNTLNLRYSDGREAKINFYIFAEELKKTRPEVIYINSFDFTLTR